MEPTPTELTLGQRLAADTPTFFKKVELVGLALAAAGGSLTQVPNLPVWVVPLTLGIGASLTLISKFAVKDTSVLANPNATIQDYANVLSDLPKQAVELEQGIAATTEAIKTGQITPAIPPAATPIVPAPAIVDQTALQQVAAQQASSNPVGEALAPNPAESINPNVTL